MAATPGSRPFDDVIAAFGATEAPARLPGGQGAAWRAGDIVIKPADASDKVLAQLLARALLFRIVADVEADARSVGALSAAYDPAVDLVVRLMRER